MEETGPKVLDAAILRVLDRSGAPIGVGFLVTDELAVTCAHVVSAALGTGEEEQPPGDARLTIDLPLAAAAAKGARTSAAVEHWEPLGDVAVLRLASVLPGSRPVRLVHATDTWGHPVRAFGFPTGRSDGVWHSGVLRARQASGWVQADLAGPHGYRISGGFSGSPVWDETLVGVVGMVVVAESGDPPAGYLIPTGGLLDAWPRLADIALPPSPFRGLSAFQERDAEVFHGRAADSGELADFVLSHPMVTLVGPSGAGKSSLAMAGVIPRLRTAGFTAAVVRPSAGDSPLSALASALLPLLEPDLSETRKLARVPELADALAASGGLANVVARVLEVTGARRLLLVIDQFEEVLAGRPNAVDTIAGLLSPEAGPEAFPGPPSPHLRVLLTLRADFLEPALAHPRLGPVLRQRVYALGPMDEEQLRHVVNDAIEAVPSVSYEAGLAERILTDAGTAPGTLPLLGFTLDLLWQEQRAGLLTHGVYERLGGVAGALGRHADQVWREYVPAEEEPAARRLFTQLIRLPADAPTVTRRTALRTELREEEWGIAQRLAATRLLVTGRTAEGVETVELAHEALTTGWHRLRDWVEEDREFLSWRESLRQDRERWERGARAPELLPAARVLAAAQRWSDERGDDLSEAERDYLERGRRQQRTRTRRRRGLFSVLGTLLALALVLGALFAYQQNVAQERDAVANSRALAQNSADLQKSDPALSIKLALSAYRASPTQEARNALLRDYLDSAETTRTFGGGAGGGVAGFQASRDGDVLLVRSQRGKATLFVHAATGRIRSEELDPPVLPVSTMVSGDGRRAGLLGADGSAVWYDVHPSGGRLAGPPHRLPASSKPPSDLLGGDYKAAMSQDGHVVAAISADRETIVWWKVDEGTIGGTLSVPQQADPDLMFGTDDRSLLVIAHHDLNSSTLVLIDRVSGASRAIVDKFQDYAVSADGTAVVTCTHSGDTFQYISRRTGDGAEQGRFSMRTSETSICPGMAPDAQGMRVAVLGSQLQLIDLKNGRMASRTTWRYSSLSRLDARLVTAAGKLLLFSVRDASVSLVEVPTAGEPYKVAQAALTRDGRRETVVLEGGSRLQIRDTADPSKVLADVPRPEPHWDPPGASDEAPNLFRINEEKNVLADQVAKDTIALRDASTLRQIALVRAELPKISRWSDEDKVGFSLDQDGNLLTVSGDIAQLWDHSTGRSLARLDTSTLGYTTSPDADSTRGRTRASMLFVVPYLAAYQVMVSWPESPDIRVVDLRSGRTVTRLAIGLGTITAKFDPSNRYLAVLRRGSTVELWRRDPLRKELGPLPATGKAYEPATSRFLDGEGRYLQMYGNKVRVYRVGNRSFEDSWDLGGDTEWFSDDSRHVTAVSGDGKTLLSSSRREGEVQLLQLRPEIWQHKLCEVIGGRDVTKEERESLPVQVPTGALCPPS